MPNPNATFFNSYSTIPSLIASNIEPFFAPSMFKAPGLNEFKVGDLLARDAGGNIVPFTYTANNFDHKFAGFCGYDTSAESGDIRVVIQGALKVSLLNFAGVKDNTGVQSNFDLAKFLALPNVATLVYDEFAFSGQQVMKLSGVSEVLPAPTV